MHGSAQNTGLLRWGFLSVSVVISVALVALVGCGAPNRHRISTGDLTAARSGDATIELAPRLDVGAIGGDPPSAPPVFDAESARGGIGSIRVESGAPEGAMFVVTEEPGADGAESGGVIEQVMIDSVVGQINGRPVFASEFFAPMDARLSALAKTLPARRWLGTAQREIRGRLRDLVRDELLLAEFESSLSVEQRSGLLFFVAQIREKLVSDSRGSEELLARKLQEEEGLTIGEKVESERRQAFIREQLRNKLWDKAYVPWRDVVLQYRQDEAIYLPAPTAHLRMIQVSGDDLGAIERVVAALAAGEAFDAIAGRESLWRPDRGGAYDAELTGGAMENSRLFGPEALNAAAQGLRDGGVAGPVVMENGRVAWVKLESVESNGTSLYDAQFAIHESLRNQRLIEEESKYFQGLISRSSLSPMQDMESRLLEIAATRYLIDGGR